LKDKLKIKNINTKLSKDTEINNKVRDFTINYKML